MDEKPEAIILQELKSSDAAIELIERLFEVAKPDAVYAEPVESGDYTVITASELLVTMGAGYGGGIDPKANDDETGGASFSGGGGGGGGGIATGRPVAAITIGPEGTTVQPIVDPTKIAIAFFTTLAAMVITLTRTLRLVRR
mgnify:CR=1 FL=1